MIQVRPNVDLVDSLHGLNPLTVLGVYELPVL